MNAFVPLELGSLLGALLLISAILLLGFFISRIGQFKVAILLAWLLVIVSILVAARITAEENPGYRMIVLIIATLFSMKAVVTVESYKGKGSTLTFVQWLAFAAGWFGMKPKLFETLGQPPLPGIKPLVMFGSTRILIGFFMLIIVKFIGIQGQSTVVKYVLTGVTLSGISLILHFGVLNISAGMWRLSGVNTSTLFRSPLSSTNLTEFWGKRWNLAFSEMTAIAIYRPLKQLGSGFAMVIAFLFSGLLHEMAISIPVMAGIGFPMIYFTIHSVLMLIEKLFDNTGIRILKNKTVGRCWVLFWLAAPMPLLFHEQFIRNIVWPLVS